MDETAKAYPGDVREKMSANKSTNATGAGLIGAESNEYRRNQPSIHKMFEDAARPLYNLLDSGPACREASMARTKLDEALLWATKNYLRY